MRYLAYTLLLLWGMGTAAPARAQGSGKLPDIAVSDSSTTYLLFPAPVSLVDVGMAHHYQVKIEANAVFVRARKKQAGATPILVRYGAAYWLGRLVFSAAPVLRLYELPGHPAAADTGAASHTPTVARQLSALGQLRKERPTRAVRANGLVLSLANVRQDGACTYLRLQVVNRSSLAYRVDFADFQLVENASRVFLGRKRNASRRPLPPVAGDPAPRIAGHSAGYLTYALPLYAATDQGCLEVTLRERDGARVLVLRIPSHVLNRAAAL